MPKNHKRKPHKIKLSTGFRVELNSFYEPESHHGPYLTEYHGVYVENPFGIRYADNNNAIDDDMKINQRPLLD